jgi:hypothetical protein
MIIRAGLIFVLAILGVYALSQQKRSPILGGLILCIAILGIGLVLLPEMATYIANWAGVGRGADLIFYLFMVVALVATFNLHLRLRAISEVTTELTRSIALSTARQPGKE